MQIDSNILICPYCGQLTKIVWVHGHGQCVFCKTNFDECCRGESADDNLIEQNKREAPPENKTKENNHEN